MKFAHWLGLAGLIAASLILWSLRDILIQIFAGVVLAMALCTLVEKIRSTIYMPRAAALTLSLLFILILLGIFLVVIVPPFTEEFQQLIFELPNAARALWDITIGTFDSINDAVYGDYIKGGIKQKIFLDNIVPFSDGATLATGVGDGIKKIFNFASNLGTGFIQLIFVIAVGLMVAVQPNAYRSSIILLIPSFYRRRASSILVQCGEALSNWMFGVVISSIFVALLAGIGLSLLGIKLVIANALLAGMLNIIPNVGPVISTIFPMSVALLDEPWKAFAVLGLYIIIQNLESYIITPSIMHYKVKLLPGLTLTAQFIFTIIFGPVGLVLALPLAVIMQVLIKEVLVHDILDPMKKRRLPR